MQKITPCLWFDINGEEALQFYTSVLKEATIDNRTYYGKGMPMPEGTLLTAHFTFEGQQFMILVGGPHFKFTEAISFTINCNDQEEVDYYWDKFMDGGQSMACGWLKDKYGLAWQIVPKVFSELITKGTPAQQQAVMQAMMQMIKFDITALQDAFDNA